ncbi:MAG: FecR domain-containing protein [Saprospiraceae bacterium]|nr:FecR domain-containing protein [Saprospiraceae bacterium]
MEEKVIQWIILESRQALPATEAQSLAEWRADDPSHEEFYQQNKLIWQSSAETIPVDIPDVSSAWDRFASSQQIRTTTKQSAPARWQWLKVAAILVALAGIGIWVFQANGLNDTLEITTIAAVDGPIEQVLADGSTIQLNAGSTLEVTGDLMTGSTRLVALKGEGFFQIHRDPSRPFIIVANDMKVEVLGTSFHVLSDDELFEVVVREGRVAVSRADGSDRVELVDDQRIYLDRKSGASSVDLDPTGNAWAWQTGVLQFQATPLDEVIRTVERYYHVKINLANPANQVCRFSSRFQRADVATVLQSIASALGMEVRSSGLGIYYLTDGKCR